MRNFRFRNLCYIFSTPYLSQDGLQS